jgi:hypothetical protein
MTQETAAFLISTSRRGVNSTLRSSGILRCVVTDVSGKPIDPFFKSHKIFTAYPLKLGPICCPETYVIYYQSALRKIPEEHRYELHFNIL